MASWGIGSEELFTSSIMLKPSYTMDSSAENLDGEGSGQELTRYQMQEKMKERLKNFIVDATHMPLQLVFLGRSMNLLAGLNRMYGSPVNRVKIMAYEASRSSSIYNAMNISIEGRYNELTPKPISSPQFANPFNNLIFWTSASWDYAKFRFVVALSDLAFAFSDSANSSSGTEAVEIKRVWRTILRIKCWKWQTKWVLRLKREKCFLAKFF